MLLALILLKLCFGQDLLMDGKMDVRTDGRTGRLQYTPANFVCGSIMTNETQKVKLVTGLSENIAAKGENTVYQHFLLFSKFSEPLTLSQMTNFRLYQIERVCRRQFQI